MLHVRKSSWVAFGAIALSLALGACGDDDDGGGGGGGGGSVADSCAQICQNTASLSCASATCQADCEADAAGLSACESEVKASLGCLAPRPASDYTCDADGDAVANSGVCDAESTALALCALMQLGGSGGSGGGGNDGGPDSCAFANDGECDEPDFCDVGTDTTDCS